MSTHDCCWAALSNIIVLEKIFKNLNARELNGCSRVCKLWRDEAVKAKCSRRQMRWHSFFCEHNTADEEWWSSVNSYFLDCPIEPRAVMMFCTEFLWSCVMQPPKLKKKKRRKSVDLMDFYRFSLPKNCSVHITVTDGIIATDESMKTQEYEDRERVMSLVMFGDYAGVELVPFSCKHAECQVMQNHWAGSSSAVPAPLQKLKKKEVKMINLYCPVSGIDQEIGYSFFRMFDRPLIAGGYVNEKFVKDASGKFNSSSCDITMSGVAICGEDVQVASVLIRDEVETEPEVDAVIKQLTQYDFPLDSSLGLMYACVGRGTHVYNGAENVESKIFRKYFPNTPLLGFFGNGEIGCSYSPVDPLHMPWKRKSVVLSESGDGGGAEGEEDVEEDSVLSNAQLKRQMEEMRRKDIEYRLKHPPKLLHAYTTVMCLVSLPKPR
ncbi:F-box only protein 22 [Aplysia californica]|uniref:F-box only protein 22 n=1 Tax=Aplysia californica TaxID=6500 RepID=A0ABM0K5E9_APLCA|nr:F-box only protein 22 [Aplysia californica]